MSKWFYDYKKEFIRGMAARNASPETLSGYTKDLEMTNRFLEQKYNGFVMLDDIKTQDLEDYLTMLRVERNYQPASVNRHLNTLRSFYKFAIRKGWTKENVVAPIDQLKAPKKERTYMDVKEYEELVQAVQHPTIKTVIQFLFYTGLRITECLSLTLEDVDLDKEIIFVEHGKGNKQRKVPISPKLMPILKTYLKTIRPKTDSNYFFALAKTGRVSDVYVNRVLHETTRKLGWKKTITCHVLRHSFASNLVKNDVHIVHIQKLLGHADLKTTSVYVHANQEQLAQAIQLL
ncbi:recombinase [Cytobacillus firmus]|nr:tyrosine-type recombinase/integrase [Cytobacillus firmus]MBG9545512.1 recombinase [Cytobacillus firmus]MBG9551173.1 recombinase [Cytobacillus firmus]MBG9557955.1 recombinase [Cytobacillus firmus]MBG9577579.1 recombinase [Cytobacillus firmus]MEC1891660.1 tyrosine-type recombinase/integrase [Cytobacillus firmus]